MVLLDTLWLYRFVRACVLLSPPVISAKSSPSAPVTCFCAGRIAATIPCQVLTIYLTRNLYLLYC